jgi:protein-tyrosine-phosphatase
LELDDYDEIHVMTNRHKTALLKLGSCNKNIKVLNIDDPFGKDESEYHNCLERLRKFYEKFING